MTAACEGQGELFDSTDPFMHAVARAVCDRCPIIDECRRRRDQAIADYGTGEHGVHGTWAGELVRGPQRDARKDRDPDRWAAEEAAYTDEQAKAARAAYERGDRTAWAVAGNRIYQRRRMRRSRAARAA